MVDHKADDPATLAASGSAALVEAGKPGRKGVATERWEGQRSWLNRPPARNARHAAITGSLQSFSSYKTWADRVRNSWDKDK